MSKSTSVVIQEGIIKSLHATLKTLATPMEPALGGCLYCEASANKVLIFSGGDEILVCASKTKEGEETPTDLCIVKNGEAKLLDDDFTLQDLIRTLQGVSAQLKSRQ